VTSSPRQGALLLDAARRILPTVERTRAGVQSQRARRDRTEFTSASPARLCSPAVPGIIRAYTRRAIRTSSYSPARKSNTAQQNLNCALTERPRDTDRLAFSAADPWCEGISLDL